MEQKIDLGKNCLISIGVILLYFFWPSIMNAFWTTFGGGTEKTIAMLLYHIFGYLILIILLYTIYYRSFKEEWNIYKRDIKHNLMSILKYTIILFFSILICNMLIRSVFHIGIANNETQLLGQFEESPIFIFLMVTFYYPLVEVVVFQKTIRQVVKRPWLFIVISSLFFGYFNIAFSELTWATVIGTIPYILLNAIIALGYEKRNTIVVPIGIKMFYNLLVTVISFL